MHRIITRIVTLVRTIKSPRNRKRLKTAAKAIPALITIGRLVYDWLCHD